MLAYMGTSNVLGFLGYDDRGWRSQSSPDDVERMAWRTVLVLGLQWVGLLMSFSPRGEWDAVMCAESFLVLHATEYVWHWLSHTRYLYWKHAMHHEVVNVFSMAGLYMSWESAILGGLVHGLTQLYLLNPALEDYALALAWTNVMLACDHSDVDVFGHAGFHETHHRRRNGNYGIVTWFDHLLGTVL